MVHGKVQGAGGGGERLRAELVGWRAARLSSAAYHHPPSSSASSTKAVMGYYSYYSFGLATFIVVVIALYLLFTGMFLHSSLRYL